MLPLEAKTIHMLTTPTHGSPGGGGVSRGGITQNTKEVKLGTWNVRSLYRAGSLKAAARELARYQLDVVCVQEVRWDKRGIVRAGDCDFF